MELEQVYYRLQTIKTMLSEYRQYYRGTDHKTVVERAEDHVCDLLDDLCCALNEGDERRPSFIDIYNPAVYRIETIRQRLRDPALETAVITDRLLAELTDYLFDTLMLGKRPE